MVDKLVNKAVICDKSGCKTLYLIYTYMISSLLLITKYYLCIERHIIKINLNECFTTIYLLCKVISPSRYQIGTNITRL